MLRPILNWNLQCLRFSGELWNQACQTLHQGRVDGNALLLDPLPVRLSAVSWYPCAGLVGDCGYQPVD